MEVEIFELYVTAFSVIYQVINRMVVALKQSKELPLGNLTRDSGMKLSWCLDTDLCL